MVLSIYSLPSGIKNKIKMDTNYPDLDPTINLHKHFREKIVLLYCNITRKYEYVEFASFFRELLGSLKDAISNNQEYLCYLKTVYSLIGYSRDAIKGRGEHDISYIMLTVLYEYYPVLAIYMLHQFVIPSEQSPLKKPYGSWRDIKYLCKIIKVISPLRERSGFIKYCIRLMNTQLRTDLDLYEKYKDCNDSYEPRIYLSTVSKWIPREHKKFFWMYDMLVLDYFKHNQSYLLNNVDFSKDEGYYRAVEKCRMIYRKNISKLNILIDTVEINYCSRKWDEIVHNKTPVSALHRDKNRILSYKWISKKGGYPELINNLSKLICSYNLKLFLKKKHTPKVVSLSETPSETDEEGEEYIPEEFMKYAELPTSFKKGFPTKISIDSFVGQAMKLLALKKNAKQPFDKQYEIDILNNEWKKYVHSLKQDNMDDFLPFIDFSLIMTEKNYYSLYVAIGLACFITECSINKRILCYDQRPVWVNLSECKNFFSMVETIDAETMSTRNTHSNFLESIKLISDAFVATSTQNTDIRKMTFVGLSNIIYTNDIHSKFCEMFTSNKIKCPRIIYWNLSQEFQSQLPSSLKERNVFLLSGNDAEQLYCLPKSAKKISFYKVIETILDKPQYQYLSEYIDKIRQI